MGVRDAASSSLKAAKKKAGIQSSASEDSSVVDSLGDMCPKLSYQQVSEGDKQSSRPTVLT